MRNNSGGCQGDGQESDKYEVLSYSNMRSLNSLEFEVISLQRPRGAEVENSITLDGKFLLCVAHSCSHKHAHTREWSLQASLCAAVACASHHFPVNMTFGLS